MPKYNLIAYVEIDVRDYEASSLSEAISMLEQDLTTRPEKDHEVTVIQIDEVEV